MDSKEYSKGPAWALKPEELKNVCYLSYADTSIIEELVDVVDCTLIKNAVKQFHYWQQELLSQVSKNTVIFCLLGKGGMVKPNVLDICLQLENICNLSKMIATFSASNNNFVGISFTCPEEANKVRNLFGSFKDCIVLHVLPEALNKLNFKILWLPPLFEANLVRGLLKKYASSFSFSNEVIKTGPSRFTRTNSIKGELKLKEGLTVENIPHFVHLPHPHKGFALIVLQSRPALCLKCRNSGHLRSQCTATKCDSCHTFHTQDIICATALYASKLKGYDNSNQSTEWWEGVSDISPTPSSTSDSASSPLIPSQIINIISPPNTTKSRIKPSTKDALRSETIACKIKIDPTHTTPMTNLLKIKNPTSVIINKDLTSPDKDFLTMHPPTLLITSNCDVSTSNEDTPMAITSYDMDTKNSHSSDSEPDNSCRKKKRLDLTTSTFPTKNSSSLVSSGIVSSQDSQDMVEDEIKGDIFTLTSDEETRHETAGDQLDQDLAIELNCTPNEIQKLRDICLHSELTSTIKKKILFLKEHGFSILQILDKPGILRLSLMAIIKRYKILTKYYSTSFSVGDICKPTSFFESIEWDHPSK